MRYTILFAVLLVASIVSGCADDLEETPQPAVPGGSGEPLFQLAVDAYTVKAQSGVRASVPSEQPEKESDGEKAIRDFWLFQFRPDGSQLAAPKYYDLQSVTETLSDLFQRAFADLTKNTPMTVYVVTNTGSSSWASGAGFDTLAKVKEQTLPSPFPIQAGVDSDNDGAADDIYIPMNGQLDGITVTDKTLVVVPVTRMYAKVKIQVGFNEPSMDFYYADVTGVPWYCKVSPLSNGVDANGEPNAVPFPDGTRMISRAFDSNEAVTDEEGNKWLIVYMPENIRGEVAEADKAAQKGIPENTLTVSIRAKYDGADFYYTVYPGENTVNNFNIRRNCVYRVTIDVRNITDQHNPSSNCYVVKPGGKLTFEPYNRAEKGGGYDISTYLDPNVAAKKIARVGIIWQTKDCIGDNTNGDLVHIVPDTDNPRNSKIVIEKTGVEGNALIGAYNSSGTIIWSWHIWVTPNEPDNIANAIVYTTYRWDSKGIYPNERIPGYGIMPCNIGALDARSADDMPGYSISKGSKFPESQIRTFGMLYQWGRKDPFPPMIYSTGTEDSNGDLEYTNAYTGDHYANDNRTIVNKTSDYSTGRWSTIPQRYLFYSVVGQDQSNPVKYAIEHPTVYLSGTGSNITGAGTNSYNNYNGDWCGRQGSDGLWGGEKGSGGLLIGSGAHIYDNYGEKSIFDPCPKGWRVPPGDLWLGFTSTGLNPTDFEAQVNYSQEESGKRPGMSMYVRDWRNGPTVYFPLQGTRIYNGKCTNTGLCGNYHNATCDDNNRVNILHLHRNMAIASTGWQSLMLFMIFEIEHPKYYVKSTAGPIRCVRDSR